MDKRLKHPIMFSFLVTVLCLVIGYILYFILSISFNLININYDSYLGKICILASEALIITFFNKKLKNRDVNITRFDKGNLKKCAYLLPIVIGCIGIYFADLLIYDTATLFLKSDADISKISMFDLIYIVLLAPFFEELLFRNIILKVLLENLRVWQSIIISALAFSLFHFDMVQSLTAFISGIFFAIIYIKTKSVLFCMVSHVIINYLSTIGDVIYNFIEKMQLDWLLNDITVLGISLGFLFLSYIIGKWLRNRDAKMLVQDIAESTTKKLLG